MIALPTLLKDIKNCNTCAAHLTHGINPVMTASADAKIVIIGQAPGLKVHESGVPWEDKSGDNLRTWMGVDEATFYDSSNFAIIPMGFCFPGSNPKGGDLPPRKECAPQWHPPLFQQLKNVKITLLIGAYAQQYYLGKNRKKNLTETVKSYEEYFPQYFPLVHPSPLNFRWQRKNPWFSEAVLPVLKNKIQEILNDELE